jgi:hypothetical protein
MKPGKVAICISGMIRTGVKAHKSFEKFFSGLDADVFFHTWEDGTDRIYKIVDLYRPKNFLIQHPFPKDPVTNFDGMGSFGNMLYSMMMANELKKKYEIENDFRYDLVIKTRFDIIFPEENKFPNYTVMPRTIYCPGGNNGFNHTDYEHHGINDILFWGDSESMDIATNVYMYYKHVTLVANKQLIDGVKFDPKDYYFSSGNLIYNRIIKQNIAVVKYMPYINECPWREDVSHLDPFKDYDKIRDRYQQI